MIFAKKKGEERKKSGTECLALLERLDEWWKVGAAGGCKTGLTWTSFSEHEAHRRAESPAVARRVGRAHFTLKLWRRE